MRGILKGRRPSPALIVAVLALSIAVAGTAVAGVATISVLDKQEKKQVKKISKKQANKRITKRASSLNVNSAKTAATANPVAYALVSSTGTVDAASSKGITQANVYKPAVPTGRFCFRGLPFTPKAGNATADGGGGTVDQYAQFAIPGSDSAQCAATDQAVVFTYNAAGALSDAGFYVVFYN